MTVQQLITHLECLNPNADVVIGKYNGLVDTYALCDHLHQFDYEQISNDFFGTPGVIDQRIFIKEKGPLILLDSSFPPNHSLENPKLLELNDSYWKQNNFKYIKDTFTWKKNVTKNKYITYNTRCDELLVMNWDENKSFKIKHPQMYEYQNALVLCNLYEQLNSTI